MRSSLLLTTATLAALAAAPALAEDAGGEHHPYIPVLSMAHAPTDMGNDVLQGGIDVVHGNLGQGGREARDGIGCLFVRLLNVGMTLTGSLFDESAGTHDAYYRTHCVGHENDMGKTLAKAGVPAGPKVIGNATMRDLAGAAIDSGAGVAAFNGVSELGANIVLPTAAGGGDIADAATK